MYWVLTFIQKAWEVAKGPGKGILMTAFMLWMAGGGVNIFSMMITMYAIINPVKAIVGTNGGTLTKPRLLEVLASSAPLFIMHC